MKKQQTERKESSMHKTLYRYYAIVIILVVSIIAEAMPYSVSDELLHMEHGESVTVVRTYSYFSFFPLLCYNIAPFMSAIATVVSLILFCYDLFQKTIVKKRRMFILIFMVISVGNSMINCMISKTYLSAIITCLLFAALFTYLSLAKVNRFSRAEYY